MVMQHIFILKISKGLANPIIFMYWDNIERHFNVFLYQNFGQIENFV